METALWTWQRQLYVFV